MNDVIRLVQSRQEDKHTPSNFLSAFGMLPHEQSTKIWIVQFQTLFNNKVSELQAAPQCAMQNNRASTVLPDYSTI
jgi:hypothetical protein